MAIPDVSDRNLAELVSLRGRRAVVTGGGRGIGRAIVERLAEAGASVLVADLDQACAASVAEELSLRYGTSVIPAHLDVADGASVIRAAEFAVQQLGGIDIWVNNAGIFPLKPLFETTDDIWNKVMEVNLRGTFVGAREAAKRMIDAGHGGVIVNIVSVSGFVARKPGVMAYVASKHGVRGLTKQLAVELAPAGIRVLGVAPSFVTTEGTSAALPKENRDKLSSLLGRVGVPDDIARVVLFCASDMAVFMTGSTLLVDAGETL